MPLMDLWNLPTPRVVKARFKKIMRLDAEYDAIDEGRSWTKQIDVDPSRSPDRQMLQLALVIVGEHPCIWFHL